MRREIAFGPRRVCKMGEHAIILVPKIYRKKLLGKHVMVKLRIVD